MTHEPAALDEFLAAYAAKIERDVVRAAPVPDIADVWARVRLIDEDMLPADLDEDELEHGEAGVVRIARARAMHRSVDEDLAPFAAALRTRVETELEERELAAVPVRRRRPGTLRIATAALALAAALVLAVIGGRSVVQQRIEDSRGANAPRVAARMFADESVRRVTREVALRMSPPPSPAPAPSIDPTPPAPAPSVAPPPPKQRRMPAPDPSAELDTLEARAQALWRAGDLAGAEAALREVIRRARKGPRVELAYGDLFAIARQRGGAAAQIAIWREYLRRFPDGRFSDDVRAGLCEHDDDAVACWTEYLQEHPTGAHAREARRIVEGRTPP